MNVPLCNVSCLVLYIHFVLLTVLPTEPGRVAAVSVPVLGAPRVAAPRPHGQPPVQSRPQQGTSR